MKGLTTAVAVALLFASQAFADEQSVLARVTVYWRGEGSGEHASWNGARLREGHCAVDPKKIPYGSKVVFPDAASVAVDSGPAVVNRKAARSCGRTAEERNAIVIDRFFDTKQKALAWAKAHPHFITVRILTPSTKQGTTNDFHQGFESSAGRGDVVGAGFIFAIHQVQNISAHALLVATCALLVAATLLCVIPSEVEESRAFSDDDTG